MRDQELRGRDQSLLDEWCAALKAGWSNSVDGLPVSLHYMHWLEEQLAIAQRKERPSEGLNAIRS